MILDCKFSPAPTRTIHPGFSLALCGVPLRPFAVKDFAVRVQRIHGKASFFCRNLGSPTPFLCKKEKNFS
jgi:hypothetical protein